MQQDVSMGERPEECVPIVREYWVVSSVQGSGDSSHGGHWTRALNAFRAEYCHVKAAVMNAGRQEYRLAASELERDDAIHS